MVAPSRSPVFVVSMVLLVSSPPALTLAQVRAADLFPFSFETDSSSTTPYRSHKLLPVMRSRD